MSATPFLDGLLLVTLSAAVALYALAVKQYVGTPFGRALAAVPVGLAFGLVAWFVDALSLAAGVERTLVAALVGGAAVAAGVAATRLFRLASGRWVV